jgi:Uma2 family endonuclease
MELAQRRRFTVDEFGAMSEAGVFSPDEHLELIDGEILEVSKEGPPHRLTVNRLTRMLTSAFADPYVIQVRANVDLGTFDSPEPDVVVFTERGENYGPFADTGEVVLAIEVSMTSLAFDRKIKSRLYARYGIAEFWLIDLQHDDVIVYDLPGRDCYERQREFRGDQPIAPTAVSPAPTPNEIIRR